MFPDISFISIVCFPLSCVISIIPLLKFKLVTVLSPSFFHTALLATPKFISPVSFSKVPPNKYESEPLRFRFILLASLASNFPSIFTATASLSLFKLTVPFFEDTAISFLSCSLRVFISKPPFISTFPSNESIPYVLVFPFAAEVALKIVLPEFIVVFPPTFNIATPISPVTFISIKSLLFISKVLISGEGS